MALGTQRGSRHGDYHTCTSPLETSTAVSLQWPHMAVVATTSPFEWVCLWNSKPNLATISFQFSCITMHTRWLGVIGLKLIMENRAWSFVREIHRGFPNIKGSGTGLLTYSIVSPNKRLNKQSSCQWNTMKLMWPRCNVVTMFVCFVWEIL